MRYAPTKTLRTIEHDTHRMVGGIEMGFPPSKSFFCIDNVVVVLYEPELLSWYSCSAISVVGISISTSIFGVSFFFSEFVFDFGWLTWNAASSENNNWLFSFAVEWRRQREARRLTFGIMSAGGSCRFLLCIQQHILRHPTIIMSEIKAEPEAIRTNDNFPVKT